MGLQYEKRKEAKISAEPTAWRSNCALRLYRDGCEGVDADTGNDVGFFADLSDALNAATKFIYMCDWSFNPHIRLRRSHGGEETIGQLLERKANEGVKVLLLVWSPHANYDVASTGFKDAYGYVRDTKVRCRLTSGTSRTVLSQHILWSRHQKLVVCDKGASTVAFVGGLDVTGGRWDTPDHPIFVQGDQRFEGDNYNGERDAIKKEPKDGWPRQPWHDIHARVEGPIVGDLFQLFEARWRLEVHMDESHLDLVEGAELVHVVAGGQWQIQRVVSYALMQDATDEEKKANNMGEATNPQIQTAYLEDINAAEDILYIENQYFIGGLAPLVPGVSNAVPKRIAEKIVAKIRAGRPIHVVIVLPLQPEGSLDAVNGNGNLMGPIVGYQVKTIRAMYVRIWKALEEMGRPMSDADHYISFFSLAKRDPAGPGAVEGLAVGSKAALLAKLRRYMIYVHSKLMISDDKRCIVGSANINERSMRADRDSEVAVRCIAPNGNVYLRDFRCDLFAEHAGGTSAYWQGLSPTAAAAELRRRAVENWRVYCDDDNVAALPHNHIVPYPVTINHANKTVEWAGIPDCAVPVFELGTGIPERLVV